MKRIFSFVLIFMFLASAFGCSKQEQGGDAGLADPITEYDRTENYPVGSEINAFSVSEKKMKQGEADAAILRIVNNTDTDYDLTVTGTFYGSDGEVVAKKTADFSGFSAKTRNFCIFEPGAAYETMICSLEASLTEGESYLNYFSSGFQTTSHWQDELWLEIPDEYRNMKVTCTVLVKDTVGKNLLIEGCVGLFRDTGDFICSYEFGGVQQGEDYFEAPLPVEVEKTGDGYRIPEQFRGDYKYVVSIYSAEVWDGTIG